MTGSAASAGPIYLGLDDALELYGAIAGCTADQAADHLRERLAQRIRGASRLLD